MEVLFYGLAILGTALLLLLARAVFRARLPSLDRHLPDWLKLRRGAGGWIWLRDLLGHLKTRPDIRYGLPWVLVIGEAGSGKAGVVEAMTRGQQVKLLQRDLGRPVKNQALKLHDRGMLLNLEASDRDGWRAALEELNNWRPERPLDSVVLMVSAESLLNADPTRLRTLARRLYFQLWSLQKEVEFVLPVYLLVTGAEAVEGFRSFWNSQPRYREQIFGWSSPFGLEARFSPRWIDLALDQLQQQLYRLQGATMAQGGEVGDADRFVLFPKRLNQLRGNLKKLCAVLFHETVYETGASVRGLYFCGSLAEGSGADFLSDLVANKIYPERNQARPLRKALLSRHRLTRRLQHITQGVFAALFLSLAFTAWAMHRDNTAQLRALQHIRAMAGESDALRTAGNRAPCLSQNQLFSLLRHIGGIRASEWRWNIPYSYPLFNARGPARLSAHYVADMAIEGLVMPTLKCGLEQRLRQLDLSLPGRLEPPLAQAAESWSRTLREVTQLGQQRENFHLLSRPQEAGAGGTATMAAFTAVTEYLYGEAPAGEYLLPDRALYHALLEVDFSASAALEMPAGFERRLAGSVSGGTRDLRDLHLAEAARGEAILNTLAGEDAARREALAFRDWYGYIRNHWLNTTAEHNHCRELKNTLAPVAALWPTVDGEAAAALLDTGNCYRPLVQGLSAIRWVDQSVIAVENGEINWSSEFRFELGALNNLSTLDSMQLEAGDQLNCRARHLSLWNNHPVELALGHLNEYQAFLHRQRKLSRERGHRDPDPLYARIGNRQVRRLVRHLIGEALPEAEEPAQPQQQLAARSDAFNRSLESLLLLKNLYRQLLPASAGEDWIDCADGYAKQQLGTLQNLAGDSFRLDADNAGDGGRLFPSLRDAPTAAAYFQGELERVQWLADLAAPYSRWLGTPGGGIDNRPARFWSDTIAELRRFTVLKDPQGDAGRLGDFLNLRILPLTGDNCREQLDGLEAGTARVNLFARRRAEIYQSARQGCDGSADSEARRSYLALRRDFNIGLAGRFPFAGPEAPDADIGQVQAFFRNYSQAAAQFEHWADDQNYRVRDFLYRMDAVAALIQPLLANEPQPLELTLDFRLDASHSPGSEQVIRWRFDNDREAIAYPNGGEQIQWQPGQPLRLTLDWARRSPFLPKPDSGQPGFSVDRHSASFREHGHWALLRLVRRHRDGDYPAGHRLALDFSVPVAAAKADTGGEPQQALFKLGLALRARDPESRQWTPLPWPESFPWHAPALYEEQP